MVKGENKTDCNSGHDFIQNKQKGFYHVTLLVDEMPKHWDRQSVIWTFISSG